MQAKQEMEAIKNLTTKIDNKLDKIQAYNGDLNNLKSQGFYITNAFSTNTPQAGYSFYLLVMNTGNYCIQIATTVNNNIYNMKTYKRQFDGTSWSSWIILGTELNNMATDTDFNTLKTTGTYICSMGAPTRSKQAIKHNWNFRSSKFW